MPDDVGDGSIRKYKLQEIEIKYGLLQVRIEPRTYHRLVKAPTKY